MLCSPKAQNFQTVLKKVIERKMNKLITLRAAICRFMKIRGVGAEQKSEKGGVIGYERSFTTRLWCSVHAYAIPVKERASLLKL